MSQECKKCGDKEFYMQRKTQNVGAYCKMCGAWKTWIKKDMVNFYKNKGMRVFQEGEPVELKGGEVVTTKKAQEHKEKDMGVEEKTKGEQQTEDKETVGYCHVCNGEEIEMEPNSQVSMAIYDGVLTVTDITGMEIQGMYNIKRCPECGRKF